MRGTLPILYANCSTDSHPPPSPPSNAVLVGKASDHYPSHLERVKYMRKLYALVNKITKKSL